MGTSKEHIPEITGNELSLQNVVVMPGADVCIVERDDEHFDLSRSHAFNRAQHI